MKRYLKIFTFILVLVTGLVAGFSYFVQTLDVSDFKGIIADEAEDMFGSRLLIGGDLKIKLFPLALYAEDLRLENVEWASSKDLANAESIELFVSPWGLLKKNIVITGGRINGLNVYLETAKDHANNWDVIEQHIEKHKFDPTQEKDLESGGMPVEVLTTGGIKLENLHIFHHDKRDDDLQAWEFASIKLKHAWDDRLAIDTYGRVNDINLRLKGTIGLIHHLLAGEPDYPVDLKLSALDTELTAKGTIGTPEEVWLLDIMLEGESNDVAKILNNLGAFYQPLKDLGAPALGSFKGKARLSNPGGHFRLTEMEGHASNNDGIDLHLKEGELPDLQNFTNTSLKASIELEDMKAIGWVLNMSRRFGWGLGGDSKEGQIRQDLLAGMKASLALDGDLFNKEDYWYFDLAVKGGGADFGNVINALGLFYAPLLEVKAPAIGPYGFTGNITNYNQIYKIIDLNFEAGETRKVYLKTSGEIRNLVDMDDTELDIEMVIEDMTDLAVAFDLPILPKSKFTGHFSEKNGYLDMIDFTAEVGSSDLSGNIRWYLNESPDRFSASLSSKKLNLDEWQDPDSLLAKKAEKQMDVDDPLFFTNDPLPLEIAKAINLDVTYAADELIFYPGVYKDVNLTFHIEDGRMDLRPLSARVGDGEFTVEALIDARKSPPKSAIKIFFDDINPDDLLDDDQTIRESKLDILVNLKGAGHSLHEFVSSAKGDVQMEMTKGQIHNTTFKWIDLSFFDELFGEDKHKESERVDLSCAAVNIKVADGVANVNNGLAIETDKMYILGNGKVDLKTEKIDMRMRIYRRSKLDIDITSMASDLVKVEGTLKKPEMAIDLVGTAGVAARIGAAVVTFGASVLAEVAYWSAQPNSKPCEEVMARGVTVKKIMQEKSLQENIILEND